MKTLSIILAISSVLFILHNQVMAADQVEAKDGKHVNQQISNSHFLSQRERNEYQTRMSNASNTTERDRIRNEYQKLIHTRTEQYWRTKDQKPKKPLQLPQRDDLNSGQGIRSRTDRGLRHAPRD